MRIWRAYWRVESEGMVEYLNTGTVEVMMGGSDLGIITRFRPSKSAFNNFIQYM